MFFIGGISSKQKKLDFNQTMICSRCGQYGRYEVFMEYMYFSVFFIPIFKWNIKTYVKSTCCGSIYSISKELGSRIVRGEDINLTDKDLQLIQGGLEEIISRCPCCGYELDKDFKFCPNCAKPLK